MPIAFTVIEKWSTRTVSSQPGTDSTGQRGFTVTATGGVADEINALTAVDSGTGPAIPHINDVYIDRNGVGVFVLRCSAVTPKTLSIGLIEVTCDYKYGTFQPPNPDPLSEPPVYSFDTAEIEEDVDRDINGNPIVNLIGDPMPGAKGTFHIDTVHIAKNLATFPYDTNLAYRNTVNASDITLFGVTIPAGYGRIVSLTPTKSFKAADTFVPCLLTIAVYDTNQMSDPWQHRIINQGAQAYGVFPDSSTAKGRIVLANSLDAPSRDILLDDTGQPYDADPYTVAARFGKAVADSFDVSPVASAIAGAITLDTSISNVCYLIYPKCVATDWSSLVTMFS